MIITAAYGALSLVTLASVWAKRAREDNHPSAALRAVGIVLVADFLLSNLSHAYLTPEDRAPFYTVIEILVSVVAFVVYIEQPARSLFALIFVSALSILSNILFSSSAMGHEETVAWQWITNGCFAAECLLAIGTGVLAREFGGFHWRVCSRRRDATPASSAAREPRSEA